MRLSVDDLSGQCLVQYCIEKIYLEKNKIKKIVNSAFSKAERSSFPNQKEAFRNLYA